MEVIIPSKEWDFGWKSARSSTSSPKRVGEYYFSAPTSPSHLSQFYKDFDGFFMSGNETGTVPFDWEEKPGTPKSPVRTKTGEDFTFDVSREWETAASMSAEELFHGGVIKPLKPPPRMQLPHPAENTTSPKKPLRKMIQGAFSPRHNKNETDPFAVAAQNAVKDVMGRERGRYRDANLSNSSSRRAARSLSPLRDTQYPWEQEEENKEHKTRSPPSTICSFLSAPAKGHTKWRLKDLFLFRSASEGRAADKDHLKQYTAALRRSSFKAVESPVTDSSSRRNGSISAHTVNRSVSQDLKKKSFLPYKPGILARLSFNPAIHALANGFGLSRK